MAKKIIQRINIGFLLLVFVLSLLTNLLVPTDRQPIVRASTPSSALLNRLLDFGNDAPSGPDQEVGIWVTRSYIYLYDNTNPAKYPDQLDGAAVTGTIFRALPEETHTVEVGGQTIEVTGTVPTAPSSYDVRADSTKYVSGDDDGCFLTVAGMTSATGSQPTSGTLSGSCGNTDTTVDLRHSLRGRYDGWYQTTDDDENIVMERYLEALSGCSGTGSVDVGSYRTDGTFTKLDSGDTDRVRKGGQTITYKGPVYGNGERKSGLEIIRTADSGVIVANQWVWCTKDDNYTRYGDVGNDRQGQGREIVISPKSLDDLQKLASDDILPYLLARNKAYAFANFFDKTSNANVARQCAINTFGSDSSPIAGLNTVEYAIYVLSKGVPGPYDDCLRAFLANATGPDGTPFSEIDGMTAADALRPPGAENGAESCSVDIFLIGDLICGLIKFIYDGLSSLFEWAFNALGDTSATFNDLGKNIGMQQAMASVRNLANIIFLLAFLVVVFQYLTDINVVDAYFVKKFVPRLLIAVVLVQASFWIVSELNNFFTDLGQSVQSLLLFGANVSQNSGVVSTGSGAVAEISAGLGAFGAFGAGAFVVALISGLVGLIMLLIGIVVLVVRQMGLIVLAIIAPLAFATIAIPQLEGLFKKWWKVYLNLLVMYPIMMAVVAVGNTIGAVLSDPSMSAIYRYYGFIAYFLPFIILPFTLKMAGGVTGNIAGKLNSMVTGAAKNKAKDAYGSSRFALGRAKNKELKRGIRADIAGNRKSDKMADKMKKAQEKGGLRARYANQRLYGGVGGTEAERARYAGSFAQKQKKQKREDADLMVANRIAGKGTQPEQVKELSDIYENAMKSGEHDVAAAAYAGLVDQKANDELGKIQADAYSGEYGAAGVAQFNKQQGENYSKLGEFAPQLRGDVSAGKTVDQHRAENLAKMSDDQLSQVNDKTWKDWHRIDPSAATDRMATIIANGGGAASKLNAEAKQHIASDPRAAAGAKVTDAEIERNFAGMPSGAAREAAIATAKKQRDNWKKAFIPE